MRRIASVLLAVSFFGNLFGGGKKEEAKPTPPPTTAVVETTEATEPPLTEEAYDIMMHEGSRPSEERVLQNKLVCYWEDEDRYSRDFIPEDMVASNTWEVGGKLSIRKSKSGVTISGGVGKVTHYLYLTLTDEVWDYVVDEVKFEASAALTGRAAQGYENPEKITNWVEEAWTAYQKDLMERDLVLYNSYDDMMMHGSLDMGFGDKLVCRHSIDREDLKYTWKYLPEELVAYQPEEVGGILQIIEAQVGYIVKLKPGDINASYDDVIAKESFPSLDEKAIAEWAGTQWKNYLAQQ